jgi:uncharacterized tellurite resistance protein B-like protein
MLRSLADFFRAVVASPEEADGAAAATEATSRRDHEVRLAACALLLELAHADDEFSDDERAHLASAMRRHFGLNREAADDLLARADSARRGAADLWQFTRVIRESYSLGQKMVLAEVMWGLVFADGELSDHEDYLMRKLANLLDLEVGYLSEARRRAENGSEGTERPGS